MGKKWNRHVFLGCIGLGALLSVFPNLYMGSAARIIIGGLAGILLLYPMALTLLNGVFLFLPDGYETSREQRITETLTMILGVLYSLFYKAVYCYGPSICEEPAAGLFWLSLLTAGVGEMGYLLTVYGADTADTDNYGRQKILLMALGCLGCVVWMVLILGDGFLLCLLPGNLILIWIKTIRREWNRKTRYERMRCKNMEEQYNGKICMKMEAGKGEEVPAEIAAEVPAEEARPEKPHQEKTAVSAPYPADRSDKWMAVWMLFVAYLMADWFWIGTNHSCYGVGVFLCTVLYGGSVLVYARWSKRAWKPEALFWFGVMALCSSSFIWICNTSLMLFLALFLRLVSLYFTAVVFDALVEGRTGGFFLLDAFVCLVKTPWANLSAQVRLLVRGVKRTKLGKDAWYAGLGCMVSLPLIYVVVSLLSNADQNFAALLSKSGAYALGRWSSFLLNSLLAVPIGACLYGQMYGLAKRRGVETISAEVVREKLCRWQVIPMSALCPVMFIVVALYLLFAGLQGSYYVDALYGVLPEAFTYSEYARQGFFELVCVSLINLAMICGVKLLYRRKKDSQGAARRSLFLRCYTVLLGILTLLLIATAMIKMILYVNAYGLTRLRVIPSLFMVFLAVVFLLVIAGQVIRVPVMRLAVCLLAAGITVLSLGNMDGRIAAYNLNRYQEGTLTHFPETTLCQGGLASVPAMYTAWERTEDIQLRSSLESCAREIWWDSILGEQGQLQKPGNANIARLRAQSQLERMMEEGDTQGS